MRRFALTLLAGLAVAACGRVGPPRPPGPAEAITHPRFFPALTREERIQANESRILQGLPPLPPPR